MVRIYVSDCSALFEEEKYRRAFDISTEYKKNKAESLANMPDKARCIGAGLLLYHALKDYLTGQAGSEYTELISRVKTYCVTGDKTEDMDRQHISFKELMHSVSEGSDQKGRPYLEWNESAQECSVRLPFISISHSGSYAAVAVSDKETGIDVQEKRNISDALKKRILSPGERDILSGDEEKLQDAMLKIWTQKEAAAKLDGRGIFEMLPLLCENDWKEKQGIRCFTKELPGGHYLSVASYSERNE
ncbi:MAG: 4'-phosphopantetheinyl transferase superfamily protein [Lachnospiraceae bacterium]|nr:4'-phosphopantetheinyl transferase superfamily protein [Lachnospiraceae bacterium]